MRREGLIKHLGISTATAEQVAEAQSVAPVVCVQNMYNVANRADDDLVDTLAKQGIAYVPARRTSCSSRARPRSSTCARTSPPRT